MDPEADHRRGMDKTKLKFAIVFTSVTAAGAAVIGVMEFYAPGYVEAGGTLGSTSEVLKLLATTSLGFVFGRTIGNGDS